MKEIILAIQDYEANCGRVTGFEILTSLQSIKLFINNERNCCERWGYFWSNDAPEDFIGAELRRVRLTDIELNEAKMISNEVGKGSSWFEGAFNEHNGYYGHEATVQCTQLTHSEML